MQSRELPKGWKWSTLGELVVPNSKAIVSGPFGSNIGSRFFVETGVPVIRGNNLTTDMTRFVDTGFVFVSDEKADELGNCDALPGDLVFTAAGSLGQVGLIPQDSLYPRYIISNKQMRARLDVNRVNPEFAFYWFASEQMVDYIQQRNTGSSVPLINLSVLRALPFPLPPISEQRAIVDILSSLDNKIQLNRRMNATLEGTAKAIFRSWFVDFDPVRARIEGREPSGLPSEVGAMFPKSFDDNSLPLGWKRLPLGDWGRIVTGKTPSTASADNFGTEVPFITPTDMKGEMFILRPSRYLSMQGVGEITSCLLEGPSILVSCIGSDMGKVSICADRCVTNQQINAILPTRTSYAEYLFCDLSARKQELMSIAGGSAQPILSKSGFAKVEMLMPDDSLLTAFHNLVFPMAKRVKANLEENLALAEIRDVLVPKLVVGELLPAGSSSSGGGN